MGVVPTEDSVVQFGEFEADLRLRQLWKQGQRVAVQEKPFEILKKLLEEDGKVVSRDDLRVLLWSAASNQGDCDHNLNVCVSKLRRVLGDFSENPRYIQTLTGRGYRFLEPVCVKEDRQPERQSGSLRVAVLPFETSGRDPEQCYFSEGLLEEIITNLGHLYSPRLGVIAKSSVMQYRETKKSLVQIGHELEVNHVLEGSVRMSQERIHITVQLVQVNDQCCKWARRYDYGCVDSLTVHDEVSHSVAQSLGSVLLLDQTAVLKSHSTHSLEAHLLYVKGCYYQSRSTETDLTRSIECFKRAVQIDSGYLLAYCGLAYSYSRLGLLWLTGPPSECFLPAREAAQTACKINDSLADPLTALAIVKYLHDWDLTESERLLCRALELNPSHALSHRVYSYLLSSEMRHEEAIVEAKRACELDPVGPLPKVCLGADYYVAGRYDEAIVTLQESLNVEPAFGLAMMWLGAARSMKSMHSEAICVLEKAREDFGYSSFVLGWLGTAYARAGEKAQARKVLSEMATLSAKHYYVSPFDLALIHAGLEQTDQSLQYLEQAFEERSPFLSVLLQVDPRLEVLHSDSRFRSLVDRLRKEDFLMSVKEVPCQG